MVACVVVVLIHMEVAEWVVQVLGVVETMAVLKVLGVLAAAQVALENLGQAVLVPSMVQLQAHQVVAPILVAPIMGISVQDVLVVLVIRAQDVLASLVAQDLDASVVLAALILVVLAASMIQAEVALVVMVGLVEAAGPAGLVDVQARMMVMMIGIEDPS